MLRNFAQSVIPGDEKNTYLILVKMPKDSALPDNLISVGITENKIRLGYTTSKHKDSYVDYEFLENGDVQITEEQEELGYEVIKTPSGEEYKRLVRTTRITQDPDEINTLLTILKQAEKIKLATKTDEFSRMKQQCLNLFEQIRCFVNTHERKVELTKLNRWIVFKNGVGSWNIIYEGTKNEDIYEFLNDGTVQFTAIRPVSQDPVTKIINADVMVIPLERSIDLFPLFSDLLKTQGKLKIP